MRQAALLLLLSLAAVEAAPVPLGDQLAGILGVSEEKKEGAGLFAAPPSGRNEKIAPTSTASLPNIVGKKEDAAINQALNDQVQKYGKSDVKQTHENTHKNPPNVELKAKATVLKAKPTPASSRAVAVPAPTSKLRSELKALRMEDTKSIGIANQLVKVVHDVLDSAPEASQRVGEDSAPQQLGESASKNKNANPTATAKKLVRQLRNKEHRDQKQIAADQEAVQASAAAQAPGVVKALQAKLANDARRARKDVAAVHDSQAVLQDLRHGSQKSSKTQDASKKGKGESTHQHKKVKHSWAATDSEEMAKAQASMQKEISLIAPTKTGGNGHISASTKTETKKKEEVPKQKTPSAPAGKSPPAPAPKSPDAVTFAKINTIPAASVTNPPPASSAKPPAAAAAAAKSSAAPAAKPPPASAAKSPTAPATKPPPASAAKPSPASATKPSSVPVADPKITALLHPAAKKVHSAATKPQPPQRQKVQAQQLKASLGQISQAVVPSLKAAAVEEAKLEGFTIHATEKLPMNAGKQVRQFESKSERTHTRDKRLALSVVQLADAQEKVLKGWSSMKSHAPDTSSDKMKKMRKTVSHKIEKSMAEISKVASKIAGTEQYEKDHLQALLPHV